MNLRLEHANLTVRHFDDAVRFLQAAFPEIRVRRQGRNEGRRWMHIGTDDTYLALTESRATSDNPFEPYSGHPGVNHLGFEVKDVEALRTRLAEAGFRDSTYPNAHPHRKRVYFRDRDGNDWEFVEYFSADPAERNDYELPG